jgi:hypothetical protein
MKSETVSGLVITLALALVGGVIFAIWLVGSEVVAALAGVLVGGLVLALIIASLALPVRAWRKNDAPPVIERHYRDGTRTVERVRTIDGRAPAQNDIRLLQLPPVGNANVYPELLRGAFRAGALAGPEQNAPQFELREVDPADPDADAWAGELRP